MFKSKQSDATVVQRTSAQDGHLQLRELAAAVLDHPAKQVWEQRKAWHRDWFAAVKQQWTRQGCVSQRLVWTACRPDQASEEGQVGRIESLVIAPTCSRVFDRVSKAMIGGPSNFQHLTHMDKSDANRVRGSKVRRLSFYSTVCFSADVAMTGNGRNHCCSTATSQLRD